MATPLPPKTYHRQLRKPSPLHEMSTGSGFDLEDARPIVEISAPYTPAQERAYTTSYPSVLQTPRAGPTEAEWRKNHVLAVLQSTARPGRKAPSTPFPSARMTMPVGEATPRFSASSTLRTPTQNASNQTFELADGSFISVASSADLTSDRRASTAQAVSHRGNTSFPNILLPTGLSNSAGGPEHRVDGAKLQKHLNAMNKQLLEENRELARALEVWQDQAERQRLRLQDLGEDADDSLELPVLGNTTPSATHTGNQSQDALLHEMAEKIEALEVELKSKDDIVTALREQTMPSPITQDLEMQLDACRAQIDLLKTEHAARTEEHAAKFEDICSGYQATIDALECQISTLRSAGAASQATAGISTEDEGRQNAEKRASAAEDGVAQLTASLAAAEEGVQHWQSLYEALLVKHDQETSAQIKRRNDAEAELHSVRQIAQQKEGEICNLTDERLRLQSANLAIDERLQAALEEANNLKVVEAEQEHQIQDLEDALDEAEKQLAADEIRLRQWRQGQRPSSEVSSLSAQDVDDTRDTTLHEALDEAHKEVGRLQQCLSNDKAAAQADQTRLIDLIYSLEKERDSLRSQLSAKQGAQSLTMAEPSGPFHKSLAALRTPGPLREVRRALLT